MSARSAFPRNHGTTTSSPSTRSHAGSSIAAPADVDFRKWGDRPHYRFPADRLGTDDAGVWLAARAGSGYTGPVCGTYANDFLILVPHDAWWVAEWSLSERIELYVDVAMPAVWRTEKHVSVVDLDLDVIRFSSGDVVLDDEDEFEEHRVLYGYPDQVVERARTTAAEVFEAVRARREPFGTTSDPWLRTMTLSSMTGRGSR